MTFNLYYIKEYRISFYISKCYITIVIRLEKEILLISHKQYISLQ